MDRSFWLLQVDPPHSSQCGAWWEMAELHVIPSEISVSVSFSILRRAKHLTVCMCLYKSSWELPVEVSLVVKTQHFQWKGSGFDSGRGTRSQNAVTWALMPQQISCMAINTAWHCQIKKKSSWNKFLYFTQCLAIRKLSVPVLGRKGAIYCMGSLRDYILTICSVFTNFWTCIVIVTDFGVNRLLVVGWSCQ